MDNKKFYTIGTIVSILLIGLVVMFLVLAKKEDNKLMAEEQDTEAIMSSSNAAQESTIDDKDLPEIKNIADNTTNSNNTKGSKTKKETSKSTKNNNEINKNAKTESKQQENVSNAKNADPVFAYPVDGEFVMNYAKDKLAYSNTLGEWVTHLGVDIKADKTTVVKSSADGKVKSIKNDPRYGLTVVIDHNNGYSTVYSNLLTAEFVKVGETVKSGQTIGTVGNTASFEILDESHLHFEILKDNEQIDPNMYLKK